MERISTARRILSIFKRPDLSHMRILHLSDIHYCETKQEDFEDFLTKLISEIKEINQEAKIDFVLITGDLINKGGSQFIANKNKPYEFFEQNVLDPIMNSIDLSKNQVFIVPGNHDVEDVDPAKDKEEYYLLDQKLKYFNDLVVKHRKNTFGGNERIKKYKEFEKRLYKNY